MLTTTSILSNRDETLVTPPCALNAIEVKGLYKSYGSNSVIHGIDLTVAKGEIFALLGPNGAGKTTVVEILEGHRNRTKGHVQVLGYDPEKAGSPFRARIGIVLQSSAVYQRLRVEQILRLFAGYYTSPRDPEEVIALVGLTEKMRTRVGRLSGGQLRRLDLALALIGDPDLIFLDEPTTGFDPAARRHAWETITNLRQLGKTILLTTHYLDEAQQLADRIAILSSGKIIMEGTPDELLAASTKTKILYKKNGKLVVLNTQSPTKILNELTSESIKRGEEIENLEVQRPSLEDLYLDLVKDDEE